jgi:hypothetical protein
MRALPIALLSSWVEFGDGSFRTCPSVLIYSCYVRALTLRGNGPSSEPLRSGAPRSQVLRQGAGMAGIAGVCTAHPSSKFFPVTGLCSLALPTIGEERRGAERRGEESDIERSTSRERALRPPNEACPDEPEGMPRAMWRVRPISRRRPKNSSREGPNLRPRG